MNHIPALAGSNRRHRLAAAALRSVARTFALAASLALSGCGVPASESAETDKSDTRVYQMEYIVSPDPGSGGAWVELQLRQPTHLLRELNMRAPAGQISQSSGDGDIAVADDRLIWNPPAEGGSLRWFARIDHQRENGGFDAHITTDWAIFRAEDVIPQAATRTLRGATSETTLRFDLPAGWSSQTEYFGRDHSYPIRNTNRRFDRPAGWIILGEIGVRYDRIAGLRVNVAAPADQGMRRMDILALLNWTLPEILRTFPDFPQRLTVIGAGDPMWRGGLSGPRSLFIHTDRPLISENATSTLLHEIMHIAIGTNADEGMDWLVEGLAEFYSLTILHRSGSISDRRFAAALRRQKEWGSSANSLCESTSSGAITARAVTVLAAIDIEIRNSSDGRNSLDDVILELGALEEAISLGEFTAVVRQFAGTNVAALSSTNLPGCGI